ncbi:MAG: TonB-dependent receptor, partial [Sphingomonadales bacterium]
MHITTSSGGDASTRRARRLAAASLYALSIASLTALSGTAWAQSNAQSAEDPAQETAQDGETAGEARITDQQGTEIIVRGFRAAIANSIAEKRRSNQIVESISAEDIGKLP